MYYIFFKYSILNIHLKFANFDAKISSIIKRGKKDFYMYI